MCRGRYTPGVSFTVNLVEPKGKMPDGDTLFETNVFPGFIGDE